MTGAARQQHIETAAEILSGRRGMDNPGRALLLSDLNDTSALTKHILSLLAQSISGLSSGSGGVTDGDKGDIIVTGGGATWTIDPAALPDVGAPVYVQEADPGGTGPLVWFQTDAGGNLLDMIVRTP